ncbi:MAG TPA: glycosyltransferase [Streptosporangiaceae bacterium]|nr:glycosyltransferase [Streptosporangiaceae bacterium]
MLILLAASVLAVAAWICLLAARGRFWRTDQRLPPAGRADPVSWPAVVAVVPARDEAEMLPQTLPALLSQRYEGGLIVLLVDDESSDGTAEVAAKLAAELGQDAGARLRVLSGEPTPPGWAGKVWAMAQGLRAAGEADYVLFTDADIGYAPGAVSALVKSAIADDRVLVSQMALLRTDTVAERLLIPAFVYFFAQLYPFRLVNRRGGRTAAAAGGCMLVRRQALANAGGLEPISGARIDDVALGGLLKRAGGCCWLGFTTDVISRRHYDGVREIWDMVARSAYTQLRYSLVLLVATVVGMIWLYLLPVAATAAGLAVIAGGGGPWLALAGVASWAIMAVSYVPVLRLCGLSPAWAACLPAIGAAYTAMTVSSALRHRAGRGGEWKGRTIQQPAE